MKHVRNLLFGMGIAAALGFGASAAATEARAQDAMVPCGTETTETGCARCCARLGFDYGWDEDFGCGCIT